jgi:hypothetical protein
MNSDDRFWLYFWSIASSTLILLTSIGVYSGYLDNQRDRVYAEKGLQPYVVTRCSETSTATEWHEDGWHEEK